MTVLQVKKHVSRFVTLPVGSRLCGFQELQNIGRPVNVAAVAIANKDACTIWALLTQGERFSDYRSGPLMAAD
jgi:hypothetical protein